MAEPQPFKDRLDGAAVDRIAAMLAASDPSFPADRFREQATEGLDALELKARVLHIARALGQHLDPAFPVAAEQVLRALPPRDPSAAGDGFRFELWPLTEFVALHGLDHPTQALAALRVLTTRFSAEFAIRPLLERHPASCRQALDEWADDPDPLVRRLVSEGTRPRLPWGARLPVFHRDPTSMLPLLTRLRDDPADTVRLSVSNHVNDLSRDHPALVLQLAEEWLQDAAPSRQKLVRHALRSLTKAGDPRALELLGHGTARVELLEFTLQTPAVALGGALEFALALRSTAPHDQELVLDLILHLQGARGQPRRKVVRWTRRTLAAGQTLRLRRSQPLRPVTVRAYYTGTQRLEVQVNGTVLAGADFHLDCAPSDRH